MRDQACMRIRPRIAPPLAAFVLAATAPTQEFASGVAMARQCMEAGQWHAAGEVLAGLQPLAGSDAERALLASMLEEVGQALRAAASFESALRANAAALALHRLRHGDRDHADVAAGIDAVAGCLRSSGAVHDALTQYETALAMWRRLLGDRDGRGPATSLNGIGLCLRELGRAQEALPRHEEALAIVRRLCGDRDHADVAMGLNNVAACQDELGRAHDALAGFEAALAMRRRLHGDRDHADVAASLANVANCLRALGRPDQALPQYEGSLAMRLRLHGDGDDPRVARGRYRLAMCLEDLGRAGEALSLHQAALVSWRLRYGGDDHADVESGLAGLARCLEALGRVGEALAHHEAALAMAMRRHGGVDHPHVAGRLNNVGTCLAMAGRAGDAIERLQGALAMQRRLHGGSDHPDVAMSLISTASCLESLDRGAEALELVEAALAISRRLHGERDHPDVALALTCVAGCLRALGRAAEALPRSEEALAMRRRLHGDGDHPDTAAAMFQVAIALALLGRFDDALASGEAALAMGQRLHGHGDHPDDTSCLTLLAHCLQSLGRTDEALQAYDRAIGSIERQRDGARASPELRQSLFEHGKRGGAFEELQRLASERGRAAEALHAAERSRGRDLLDLLAQLGDADAEAGRRARLRGDELAAQRLAVVRAELDAQRAESSRLLHELSRLAAVPGDERSRRRTELRAQADASGLRLRQLADERARLLGDVLPVGRVATAAEIAGALRQGELLLEFTVTPNLGLLHLLAPGGESMALPLPEAHAAVQRLLPALLFRSSRTQLRGRDPAAVGGDEDPETAARELFRCLIPPGAWERIRRSRRVFVAAHRDLHRLPFELLVPPVPDGAPWLDAGPPIAYVPSGTVLRWLRQRAEAAGDDATALDLVGVGDPTRPAAAPPVPELGVFVLAVDEAGEGARAGLQPGDVLTSYDLQPLADDRALRDVRTATEVAIEDGRRDRRPIPIHVWRRGRTFDVDVQPGPLGIQVGRGGARAASVASLGDAAGERITRAGDLERLASLPPLRGARAEIDGIAQVFGDGPGRARRLLGADATEPAVFDLAAKAKYLHFACHGIAEEYAGQSLSMLVLAPPERVLPGADGLLQLGDLLSAWRGRLASCRLVVLSACSTNVGPTLRDEAPQALPIGFLFAGASAVVCSLWAVDDASTRELMVDFYGRLSSGQTDRLAAFVAAKRALRRTYPDPFHWAPFLYLGSPD